MITKVKDIKIKDEFKQTRPSRAKIEACEEYFKTHGTLDREIIIDENGCLIDGYIGYLILTKNNVETVETLLPSQAKKTFVFGRHSDTGKEYVWIVPRRKHNMKIAIGDKILVKTKYGVKPVNVTRVEIAVDPPVSFKIKPFIKLLPKTTE